MSPERVVFTEAREGIRNKIIKNPFAVIFVMLLLHVLTLFSTTVFFVVLFGLEFVREHYYIISVKNFVLIAVLWLWLFPMFLKIPFGEITFFDYIKTVKLTNINNFRKNFMISLACTTIIFVCLFCSTLILGGSGEIDMNRIFPPDSWILIKAISPGLWEEFMFRGVFLTVLLKKYKQNFAIVVSALIFGGMHIFNLFFSDMSYTAFLLVSAQMIYTFFIGLFLGYLFIKTDSLLPGIIIHYLVDALGVIFIFPENLSIELFAIVETFAVGIIPAIIGILIVKYSYKNV